VKNKFDLFLLLGKLKDKQREKRKIMGKKETKKFLKDKNRLQRKSYLTRKDLFTSASTFCFETFVIIFQMKF
jgi:hypothetical protein